MSVELNATKKKLFRKRILQLARELYLHPQLDSTIKENLKASFPELAIKQVREIFSYLAQKELVTLHRNKSRVSIQIAPKGIDLLDGAINVRGVENGDPHLARLAYKKELRRGILSYCATFNEFFNEDTEIHTEFKNSGFGNLLLEEIRFHMWYLRQKSFIELKVVSLGGDIYFLAHITAAGIDIVENSAKDAGVSVENG